MGGHEAPDAGDGDGVVGQALQPDINDQCQAGRPDLLTMLWEILLILLLILANGVFAAAETSLIAARKGRLEQRAAEGHRNARRALELANNPDLFLPTAQIGISVVS